MFIKNTQQEPITNTYEGFEITVNPGVSAIWDQAGAFFIERYEHKGELPNKPVVPAIVEAKEKDWNGGQYAEVRRFKIDWTRLPDRKYVLALARQRGVSKDRIQEFIDNDDIDTSEIVAEINKLPVPEEIRFPVKKLESVTA